MYGKSDEMPKGIIKHNQKLRRDVERAKRHFMRAAETIKDLREECRVGRRDRRRAKVAIAEAEHTISQLEKDKLLYSDRMGDYCPGCRRQRHEQRTTRRY
jgi:hypothetical protein